MKGLQAQAKWYGTLIGKGKLLNIWCQSGKLQDISEEGFGCGMCVGWISGGNPEAGNPARGLLKQSWY